MPEALVYWRAFSLLTSHPNAFISIPVSNEQKHSLHPKSGSLLPSATSLAPEEFDVLGADCYAFVKCRGGAPVRYTVQSVLLCSKA